MPQLARRDPIVARATPLGGAARAVLRLSGPDLLSAAARWLPAGAPAITAERQVVRLDWPWCAGAACPVALHVFPGPESATGEDVLEFHLPGSAPVVDAVLATLVRAGARLAEPGEFTRRAFLNGRLDLTQAEAVAALVSARTRSGARAAAGRLAGAFGQSLQAARAALANALAELEAGLDFEEGDAADVQPAEVRELLTSAKTALAEAARGGETRRRHDGDFRVGLVGQPNAGKTALYAWLTGEPALVSDEPGTTRDRREAGWALGDGVRCRLIDGPGVGGPPVDARDAAAREQWERPAFDLVWLVTDGSASDSEAPARSTEVSSIVVWTKADLPRGAQGSAVRAAAESGPAVWVSAVSQAGATELAAATRSLLEDAAADREARAQVGERQGVALERASAALARAEALVVENGPAELVAEELRAALEPLGELVGVLTPEHLLDQIFARFCIGK